MCRGLLPNQVGEDVAMNKIGFTIIKGANPCVWCDKAVALLESHSLKFKVDVFSIGKLQGVSADLGVKSVPIIYHGVRFIGGYEELRTYLGLTPRTDQGIQGP